MSLGVGIIGCGLMGTKRARALPEDMRLVALCDADETRAQSLATSVGGAVSIVDDADGVAKLPDVDIVVVATPHRELATLAQRAVEAGKHVLVEKPGGRSSGELESVRRAAQRAGVVVAVGFNHRFHPAMLEARRLVEEDGYGALLHVRARYGHGGRLGYEREWRADREAAGGGELIDQGIHLIDLTRFVGGDVELAFSELRTDFWQMDVEDNAFLALRLMAGGFAWLHASWTEWKNLFSFEIALERAKIDITGLGGSYGTETLTLHEMSPELGPPQTRRREWPESDTSWRRELEDLVGVLDGGTGRGARIEDGIAALRTVEEAYGR